MGDSYEKVQEKRILTDNHEKIELMLESIQIMKFLSKIFRFNRNKGVSFLHYVREVQDSDDAEGDTEDWEGRINLLKRLIISKNKDTKAEIDTRFKEYDSKLKSL
mmetsp:Transcript_22196/g.19027  ORF Transcript_22196/g.19027 Transcript_22196/m.19027 type:complete len:105 (+) Transcript_22196:344-658(+)|eukprot:CAMPEP_0114598968 /NCGR_PEP_ID=MMETSP0125-20121206/21413_1 /TAXON_ID=485358 ORGANISM="Aristerostoma sp., Strain ATCC 50986" /NCGR_SAMPLE_ID=MMETSP0125 /ASSEMBLY_ACC=CAM_ASM_000245 /LENGTH=104 /DNA_ID=CAMNT_0001805379 /DNA_START=333 /DNA_END=647 /DNA_ORIENTATION=+